ncbi:MAG: hypothetical protein LBV19_04580 [Streptococcaceae bacterium]|nr:hypothetical protein [Streptococcaceae bacterium]
MDRECKDSIYQKKLKLADDSFSAKEYLDAITLYNELFSYLNQDYRNDLGELNRKLADCYYALEDWTQARKFYEHVLDYTDKNAAVFSRLASLYYAYDIEKAIPYYKASLSLKANEANLGNLCLSVLKSDKYDQAKIKEEIERAVNFIRPYVVGRQRPYEEIKREKLPGEKLNIGYLSSDFYAHAMMEFILPLLEHHDQESFNFTLYSCNKKNDATTERIKATGIRFTDVSDRTGAQIARRIYNDRIDILVDLGGHTHACRVNALFFTPAPIQMQYLGFVNTLGMKEVDYIWADEFVIPREKAALYTEKPFYLKSGMHCFDFNFPAQNIPAAKALPLLKNGYLTFGSFNDMSKISYSTLDLWAALLHRVDHAKLLIYRTKDLGPDKKDWFVREFQKRGIGKERLILSNEKFASMFSAYSLADIGLDPTPYGGLTITIEQAYMGLPTITLVGEGMQSRGSAAVNRALHLEEELNASSKEAYISKAAALANDIVKLNAIHEGLRNNLVNSTLFTEGQRFAQEVEEGYRRIWTEYIES